MEQFLTGLDMYDEWLECVHPTLPNDFYGAQVNLSNSIRVYRPMHG